MTSHKTNSSEKVLEMIISYQTKSLSEIRKIQVRWACGINKKHRRYKAKGSEVFYVKLENLISTADFGEMMYVKLDPQKLFVGIPERDFRIAKVLYHCDNNGYIDPPEIFLDVFKKITFADGRHRTIAAFHLGEEYIPVLVDKSAIDKISKHIELLKHK